MSKNLLLSKASKVALDPGVLFSGLHAVIFSGSPSTLIQGLGYGSLALTASVAAVRNFLPETNDKIANKFNSVTEKLNAPKIDSIGFPLFLNGVVLSGIALASLAKGDYLSASISLSYAIANTDKGARISGNNTWTLENVCQKTFEKVGANNIAENPLRIIKHSLYLPELWGSLGAFIYGASHSGWTAAAGLGAATVAVTAASINNGSANKPSFSKIIPKSVRGGFFPSDQVISRGFMTVASGCYAAGAVALGNYLPAGGHGLACLANGILTKQDRGRQAAQLNAA